VAKLVNGRMCDAINLKVTKLGGIRNMSKAVRG
jgi:L-alanine-DL-glutamate epimerase-like enolase superfamily enzyme